MFENPCVSNGYAPHPAFVFHQGSVPLWTTSFTDGPPKPFCWIRPCTYDITCIKGMPPTILPALGGYRPRYYLQYRDGAHNIKCIKWMLPMI